MKENAIVLYPSPAIGHLISMVELGKLIHQNHPSISIHIITTPPPFQPESTAPYLASVAATTPSITFHNLPTTTLPASTSLRHHETSILEVLFLNVPYLRKTLSSISEEYTIRALVADFFCFTVVPLACEVGIPVYYFFTSGACFLASFIYFPTLHEQSAKSFIELAVDLEIPGNLPIPSSDMPKPMLERDNGVYVHLLDSARTVSKLSGIIVNTFETLEPRAIKAIADGLCVPDGLTPPIYPIGPLIMSRDDGTGADCLTWLDSQPKESVVFLCFGSLGLFSRLQLQDIALGLERSGKRFLWVVRKPPSSETQSVALDLPDPDLEALLPDGFVARTKERGFVVKSWAPQVAVLRHRSVGGFVTHCGWNSVLEAVTAGVPMVAWPLYAEQRFNRVVLVEELKIALPIVESSEDGFVGSDEVEKRVRQLMESTDGDLVREQVKGMKCAAEAALKEGGSSVAGLTKLVQAWKNSSNWN